MKSELKQITQTELSELTHTSKPMALLFMAEWCGECQIAESILSQIKDDFAGKVSIYKIDTDKEPEIKSRFGIHRLPTLLVSDNKNTAYALVGVNPKYRIKDTIQGIVR